MVISVLQAQIFVLVLTRVLMIMLALPFLGGALVPNQVKISLGVILALFVFPWQTTFPANADAIQLIAFIQAILQEMIIGLLAGISVSMVFGVFQIAAKMMETSAGFSSAQIFNPTLNDTGSAYDQFFLVIVYLYFFSIDGHQVFLMGLQKTFQVFPVHSSLDKLIALKPDVLLQLFTMMLGSGIQMALPVVGSILLTDMTLGLLNKVAPQIQVFFIGINIKVLAGLAGLSLILGYITPILRNYIGNINILMSRLLEFLHPIECAPVRRFYSITSNV